MTHRFNLYQRKNSAAKLAVVVGLMGLAPGLASAQPRCSILKGTYAFTSSGTVPFPGPPAILAPFNVVGFQTFDGAGKFTGTESGSFPGFVLRSGPISGTYKLNPDCTGTMKAIFPDGSSSTADFVLASGGRTIYAIGVDSAPPGASGSLTLTRFRPSSSDARQSGQTIPKV